MMGKKAKTVKWWTDLMREPESRESGKSEQGREGVVRRRTEWASSISPSEADRRMLSTSPQYPGNGVILFF